MLIKHTHKFSVALKVAIVFLATGYIAWRLLGKGDIHFSFNQLFSSIQLHPLLFGIIVLLMPLNWFLEAIKWKLAASREISISMKESILGVLAGVTIGTATPNRVGEFAGRIFMVKGGNRFQLLLLSFIPSFAQVVVTVLVGIVAFIFHPEVAGLTFLELIFLIVGTIILFVLPFLLGIIPEKWNKKIEVIKTFPRTLFLKILFLSFFRYSVYVMQFLLVLNLSGASLHNGMAIVCISISYFIVTMIPTFSFTEVLVRGGIAGLVFANGGGDFDVAFSAAVTLWAINVAVPSLLGSVFVFRLKFYEKET